MPVDVRQEGRLARVVLDRAEKRNALDTAMCRELVAALERANGDSGVGAVLVEGAGPAFCAGMDLKEVGGADLDELAAIHERLFTAFDWMRKPVIAAVQGPAIAGETGIVVNAHIVIAEAGATFGLTEVRIGLWPVLIFPAVVAAVGERRAMELSLTGRVFGAAEGHRLGIVSELVASREELTARSVALAISIAESSSSAIQSGLEYCRLIRGKTLEEAGRIGHEVRGRIMAHPHFAEGVRAFREKRKPNFT